MPDPEPKRILLFLLLPIGDTLFTTPAIHALRVQYPRARISALAYPTNVGLLSSNPDIDELILWPTRQDWPGLSGVLRLFGGLRRAKFDLSIEFSNYAWWVTRLSRIPKRSEMNLPKLWWGLPGAGRAWRKRHAVEHYCDVVRRIGVPVTDMRLRITPSQDEVRRAGDQFERHGLGDGATVIGLHLGGEGLWGRKRWPLERFAQVADALADRLDAQIVVMGGKDEVDLAASLVQRAKTRRVVDVAGKTTLGETAAMAARCALFIGNDSSPLHIAAASGTPVIGIYGPTDPRSYRPWKPGGVAGRDYAVVRSHLKCACRFPLVGGITFPAWFTCLLCPSLESITPERVIRTALSMLAANRQPLQ